MITAVLLGVLIALAVATAALFAFLLYIVVRYTPHIVRVFEEKPLFLPIRVAPTSDAEEVRFSTADGFQLVGSYLKARTRERAGVVVFCHEYLSDRWSVLHYADELRDLGFDLFSFDFRNHGQSESDPNYQPLQWLTEHELADVRSALAYLRSREDADSAGFGLFGISRGGGAALCVGAEDPGVWAVATDGAFSTRGTMLAYILRWAEIYVGMNSFYMALPVWVFSFVGWAARLRSQWRLHCRFPDVERAVARLSPRPWFMIHGQKDVYIGPEIARSLFDLGGEPKELWIVPRAKHNRCREVEPLAYAERLTAFFRGFSPRRTSDATSEPAKVAPAGAQDLSLGGLGQELLEPIAS